MNFERYADYVAAAIIVVVFILYANITLNSPIVFGDEGYYGATARWMAKNLIIPEFTPLFENEIVHDRFFTPKPVFFLYETFGYFFGGEDFVKLLIPLPVIAAAAFIYLIGKKRCGWPAGIAAIVLFLMTPSLITYGVLGYVDVYFISFFIAAVYFGVSAFENNKKIHLILAGVFAGLSIITKNSGVAILLFFLLYGVFVDKLKNKKCLMIFFLIAIIVIAPWLARNQIIFGSTCYWKLASPVLCTPKYDVEIPKVQELQFEGRTSDIGTEVGLIKFGFLNYSRFAYGWALPFLFLIGLALSVIRKNNFDKIVLILLVSTLPLFIFSTWRAEDTARYMLPLNISMVLISGAFVSEIFNYASKKHIALGCLILILVIWFAWIYGNEKIITMMQVKQFVPGAIDGCKWVRENTPADSIIFATYGSQIRYQCERKLTVAGDAEEVMLGNETISYEHLKLNGINYIFVINGLISPRNLSENYPVQFVSMIEDSTHFKKVYDNTEKFGINSVSVFEVL